jgi:peptidoglycan/xylan/chitin deacetylase (PgdA/CDA1 family)
VKSIPMVPTMQVARLGGALYYNGLRSLGLTAAERRFRDAALILCYHNVVPDGATGYGDPGLHLPLRRFATQIEWLVRHYAVVSLGELVERVVAGRPLGSLAAITFDDAYAGVFDQAVPVLQRAGIPATVFVVGEAASRETGFWWDRPAIVRAATATIRNEWLNALRGDARTIIASGPYDADPVVPPSCRAANWETIRASLDRGIEVGVHSATHRTLPMLSDSELEYEVIASRAMVQQATGAAPQFFAYPYGCWDSRVRAMVQSAGYRAGLTLDAGRNRACADQWTLRRLNIPAGISGAAFEAWTAGFLGRGRA